MLNIFCFSGLKKGPRPRPEKERSRPKRDSGSSESEVSSEEEQEEKELARRTRRKRKKEKKDETPAFLIQTASGISDAAEGNKTALMITLSSLFRVKLHFGV